jgi:hypothetical protein
MSPLPETAPFATIFAVGCKLSAGNWSLSATTCYSFSYTMRRLPFLLIALFLTTAASTASAQKTVSASKFGPFQKWCAAILVGDARAIAAFYRSSEPPQLFGTSKAPIPFEDELNFWAGWKSHGLVALSPQIVKDEDPRPGVHVIISQLTLTTRAGEARQNSYVSMIQTWFLHGDDWVIGISQRSPAARLRQPLTNKDIYPANANASEEIAAALKSAAASRKRVLVVFGGNWCFDCHVLDEAFHSPEIAPFLNKFYLVVHVDIGHNDKNLDIAQKYEVPLDRGVPALAVLDSDGTLLFSQKRGEFEAARSMAPQDILNFLNKWKPTASHTN